MKILTLLLSLGLMVFLGQQAVTLHKLTVCRQEAWRASLTLHTRTLLSGPSAFEKELLSHCRILVSRNEKTVSWVRLTQSTRRVVFLNLRGKL